MTYYVRAARHATDDPKDRRTHVTGDVLHLSVWAHDLPGTALLYGTGRRVPLCGGTASVALYRTTGNDFPGWERHSHFPVCRRCVRALDTLVDDFNDQELRAQAHEGANR